MWDHVTSYAFAFLLGSPVVAFMTGICLHLAYRSRRAPLKFRWGSNALGFLSMLSIVLIVRQNCAWITNEPGLLINTLAHPTTTQLLMPASTGCAEFLLQVFFLQRISKGFTLQVFPACIWILSALSLLTSWACTLNIAITSNSMHIELFHPPKFHLPSFYIQTAFLAPWLATATLTQWLVFAGRLYSNLHTPCREERIVFEKSDSLLAKLGVLVLQTSAINGFMLSCILMIYIMNILSGDNPSPLIVGWFVFFNILRISVNYVTLIFCLMREFRFSVGLLQVTFVAKTDHNPNNDAIPQKKIQNFGSQVTIHTTRSQVIES
ncbi:hypothetical protein O181_001140 [Austropuccinia psidii MF-1]|uniref:Uncharacterized protein n=1 Tax=Austropuccinia psidii MF-1 TaxID=1389203 RepID=A0A9Q3GBJ1_9BASI|nr:hypothetical protein [Austropuccinia psidii MF-1]